MLLTVQNVVFIEPNGLVISTLITDRKRTMTSGGWGDE